MGDRADRKKAWRRACVGGILTALAFVSTVALAVAIPTQGENPRAWGVIVCGLVTVGLCWQVTARNRKLLRHYRGDDLLPPRPGARHPAWTHPTAWTHPSAHGQARAKAAR